MNNNATKGTLCSIGSALVFGLTPVLASMTYAMGSTSMTMTFYRNALAIPFILAVLLLRKVDLRLTKKELKDLLIISICFNATTTFLLYESYNYVGIGLATTLHFLYPTFTVLFAHVFFKDKLTRVKGIALFLATLGVVVASGGSGTFALKGVAIAICSAITYSGYLLSVDKTSIHGIDAMKSMFYICLFNTPFLALVDIPFHNIVYDLDFTPLLLTLIVAVANSAIAFVLLNKGIQYIGAGNAAIFSTLEPVFGVISGVVFLSETLPLHKLLSCILIILAVMIPIVYDLKKRSTEP